MYKFALLLLVLVSLQLSISAQRDKPGSETELAEITKRGKMLAEYDVAAWHSTDAVMALSPKEGSFTTYIGKKDLNSWTVAYGKLNSKKDSFSIIYEAKQLEEPKKFKVEKFDSPKEDIDYFFRAALALETAKSAFVPAEQRPYNAVVLPATEGQFYVYFMPAQTKIGIFPLGGDVRFMVSKDGSKILGTRQMHKSIIEFSVPKDTKPQMGYHTAILDDIPEDTDVFHVLAREPKVPELVVTAKYIYRILIDGSIYYLMTTEAFKKIGNQP